MRKLYHALKMIDVICELIDDYSPSNYDLMIERIESIDKCYHLLGEIKVIINKCQTVLH